MTIRTLLGAVLVAVGALTPARAAADTRPPRVQGVSVLEGSRQLSDTYVLGNVITVVIDFDEEIRVQGGPTLQMRIGSRTREVTATEGGNALWFEYRVQSSDYDPDGISIAADAIRLNGGSVKDLFGNDADLYLGPHAIANDPDHKVDGRRDPSPAVKLVEILSSPPQGDTYTLDDEIMVRVRFDEDVIVAARPTLALSIGTTIRQAVDEYTRPGGEPSGASLLFRYNVQAGDVDPNGISIKANALRANVRDGTGQTADLSLGRHAIADDAAHKVNGRGNPPAVVTRVRIIPPERAADTYLRRDIIHVQVRFSREVVVTGSPRLALNIGGTTRHAAYHATDEFGEGRVFFRYEVQATDFDDDGLSIAADALTVRRGTIRDVSGQDVELDLGRHAVTNAARAKVDGGSTRAAAIDRVELHSRPQRGDTYGGGDTIEVWVVFDAEVQLAPAEGRPMELALGIGARTRLARFKVCVIGGETDFTLPCEKGTVGLVFAYEVQRDDVDDDGVSVEADAVRLNGWRIRDRNGNDVDVSLGRHAIIDNPRHKVSGDVDHPPAITSLDVISRPQRAETYGAGELIRVALTFDERVWVSGEPTLALRVGTEQRQAAYATHRAGGFEAVAFVYEVRPTDRDADGIRVGPGSLRLNGGSIRDSTGRDADTHLGLYAIADHPDHKVDGTVNHAPRIADVSILSRPEEGDTYRRGEDVRVRVVFDEELTWERSPADRLRLALTIGPATRLARLTEQLTRDGLPVGFDFTYGVQRADRDADGISIGENALRGAGVLADRSGNGADLALGRHAIEDHPAHRVEGGDGIRAVSGLPPLELLAGEEAATVDLSQAFRGGIDSYAAVSSNPSVSTVGVAGAVLTVTPVRRGTATIRVTARNETDSATQTFRVTVLPAVEVVGMLPPLELVAGGETATVDLSGAFRGAIGSYSALSSDPEVAAVTVADAVLTVTPGAEGTATIEATARARVETAIQRFTVTVVTDPAEIRVLEHTLAALGRSVLASVTMAVEGRFEAPPGRTTATMSGWRLPVGAERSGVSGGRGGSPLRSAAEVGPGGRAQRAATRLQAESFNGTRSSGRLTGDDLVGGSRFLMAFGGGQPEEAAVGRGRPPGVRWTVWGSGDLQPFAGQPQGDGRYDGDLLSGHVGVDAGGERWLAGAVVSRSAGQVGYGFGGVATGSGQVSTTLTSVQPYLRWTPREGTAAWAILGAGGGAAENARTHVGGRRTASRLSMRLGVVGARHTLASVGRLTLTVRGDVGMVRLATGDGAEVLDGLTVTVRRSRIRLETAHTTRWANGASLTPFVAFGGRHDGGAGQTGSGLEVAGGVRLAHPAMGFGLEARGRMLALHTSSGYRERGLSVTALLAPGGRDGRGWLVAVTPGWGPAVGGTDTMWSEQALGYGPPSRDVGEAASLEGQLGYGFGLRAERVLTPFTTFGSRGAEHNRLRVGLRLTGAAGTKAPLDIELAGDRTETSRGPVDHRLGLSGTIRF